MLFHSFVRRMNRQTLPYRSISYFQHLCYYCKQRITPDRAHVNKNSCIYRHVDVLQLGSFSTVKNYVFPVWFAAISVAVICLESQKQYRRFFNKGAANCACVTVVNEGHFGAKSGRQTTRLMPRTEEVDIYSVKEFNEKVGKERGGGVR